MIGGRRSGELKALDEKGVKGVKGLPFPEDPLLSVPYPIQAQGLGRQVLPQSSPENTALAAACRRPRAKGPR